MGSTKQTKQFYLNNPNIPAKNAELEGTEAEWIERAKELKKCKNNIFYFAKHYIYILNPDNACRLYTRSLLHSFSTKASPDFEKAFLFSIHRLLMAWLRAPFPAQQIPAPAVPVPSLICSPYSISPVLLLK